MKKYILLSAIFIVMTIIPTYAVAGSENLKIEEFRVDGETTNDEYVVLANYGTDIIDLNLFSLTMKTSATTYSYLYKFGIGSYIKPGERIRICHNSAVDKSLCNLFNTAASYSMKESGVLALIDNTKGNKVNVDIVGYGELDYGVGGCWLTGCEEYPLDMPAKNTPYKRVNCQDTNRGYFDFEPVVILESTYSDPNIDKIVISELMPAPDSEEEWFELYNQASLPVSLSGVKICDAVGSIHCYYFAETEMLKPFEYKTYSQGVTKITLNNTGDWLELRDGNDNLLTDSGGNYGNADSAISLSLFGNDFNWTKTATPNEQNIYTDTVEIEEPTAVTPKSTSKKVKAAVVKKASSVISASEPSEVAGASTV
ncbi:MAG: lamin tail domain-containing protein, partial [Coriobacteriia bacterium]